MKNIENIYKGEKLLDPPFTPKLIGNDNQKAEKHLSLFDKGIKILNQLIAALESFLAGPVELNDITSIIEAKDLEMHLKKLFIARRDIKFEINNADLREDTLLEMIKFPDYKGITVLAEKLNSLFKNEDPFIIKSLRKNLDQLYIDHQFVMTSEIQKGIYSNYEVYTNSVNQNIILIGLERMAEGISILNLMCQGLIIPGMLPGILKSFFKPFHVQGHIFTVDVNPYIFTKGIFKDINNLKRTPDLEGFLIFANVGIDSELGKFEDDFETLRDDVMPALLDKIKEIKKQKKNSQDPGVPDENESTIDTKKEPENVDET